MKLRKLAVRFVFAAGLASAAASGVVACSSPGASAPAPDGDQGTISAALTAVGPDGALYTFNAGAYLQLNWSAEAGPGSTQLTFNATTPTQSFSVPAGTYSATLANVSTLARNGDGGASSVTAVLNDPQPYSFTVTPGGTTALTFHFTIEGVGNITFSTGTLTTSLQVDAGTANATKGTATGTANFGNEFLGGPSALNTALQFSAPVAVNYTINFSLTGPFAPGLDSVCAPATVTVNAPQVAGTPSQNLAAFLDETSGGTGTFCTYDANNPYYAGYVTLNWSRTGAPVTQPMITALGSAPTSTFEGLLYAKPATPVYNGTVASFSQFTTPVAMPLSTLQVKYDATNTYVNTTNGAASNVTLQLSP
jgi:hypothetical protein